MGSGKREERSEREREKQKTRGKKENLKGEHKEG